jgi:hypothetical protein
MLVLISPRKRWLTYLRNGRGKNHNLVQLADPLHELIHTWSLDDVYIVVLSLNLDGDSKVGLM